MAIVPNKDGQGIKANGFSGIVDPSYEIPSLVGAAIPTAASAFANQLAINTTTGEVFRSLAAGSTAWVETNIR